MFSFKRSIRLLSHISTTASALANEVNKVMIFAPDYLYPGFGKDPIIVNVKKEIAELAAVLDHLKSKGINFNDNLNKLLYERKKAGLRMEDCLEEFDCTLPVPSDQYEGLVDFWIRMENFCFDYPASIIYDHSGANEYLCHKNPSQREQAVGRLSEYQHVICEWFTSIIHKDGRVAEDRRTAIYSTRGISYKKFLKHEDGKEVWMFPLLWRVWVLMIQRLDSSFIENKVNEQEFLKRETEKLFSILSIDILNILLTDKYKEFTDYPNTDAVNKILNYKLEIALKECNEVKDGNGKEVYTTMSYSDNLSNIIAGVSQSEYHYSFKTVLDI